MSTLDEMEMPTLTFDPTPEPEEKAPVVPVQEEKAKLDDSMLNDKERRMVESFAKQIDLHNTNGILQYGAGTQKKMADFSEKALENVKTKDLGSVGDMLTNVVTELKSFDAQEEEKGFFSFLKKPVDKITSMKTKYDKVETNVEKICTALEDHQTQLMKDVAMLDRMYEQNLLYFKELSMYILAGKKKLEEVKTTELTQLMAKAQAIVIRISHDIYLVYLRAGKIFVHAIRMVVTDTKKNISSLISGKASFTAGSSPTVAPVIIRISRARANQRLPLLATGSVSLPLASITKTEDSPHVCTKESSAITTKVSPSRKYSFSKSCT